MTGSGSTPTPSKRELEKRVGDLEAGEDGERVGQAIKEASIATMLGAMTAGEYERMNGEPGLIRCSGEVYQVPTLPSDALEAFDGDNEDKNAGENGGRDRP